MLNFIRDIFRKPAVILYASNSKIEYNGKELIITVPTEELEKFGTKIDCNGTEILNGIKDISRGYSLGIVPGKKGFLARAK